MALRSPPFPYSALDCRGLVPAIYISQSPLSSGFGRLVEDWKVGSKEMSGYFSPSLFWEATQVVAVSPWLQILLDSPHLPICLLCSSTTLVTNSLCQTPSVEPSNNCCFPHQTPTNTARLWIICRQFSIPLLYTLVCILNLISTKRRKWKARERRKMNCQRLSITLAKSKSLPIFPQRTAQLNTAGENPHNLAVRSHFKA